LGWASACLSHFLFIVLGVLKWLIPIVVNLSQIFVPPSAQISSFNVVGYLTNKPPWTHLKTSHFAAEGRVMKHDVRESLKGIKLILTFMRVGWWILMLLKETYRQIDTLLVVMRLPPLYGIRVERKNSGKGQKSTECALCMYVLHSFSRNKLCYFHLLQMRINLLFPFLLYNLCCSLKGRHSR